MHACRFESYMVKAGLLDHLDIYKLFQQRTYIQIISFLQYLRKKKDTNTYQGTTWQIKFKLDTVDSNGAYKLRLALASSTLSELQVLINLIPIMYF